MLLCRCWSRYLARCNGILFASQRRLECCNEDPRPAALARNRPTVVSDPTLATTFASENRRRHLPAAVDVVVSTQKTYRFLCGHYLVKGGLPVSAPNTLLHSTGFLFPAS